MSGPTDAAIADYDRRNKHWLDTLCGPYTSLDLPSDLPQDLREMLEAKPLQDYPVRPDRSDT